MNGIRRPEVFRLIAAVPAVVVGGVLLLARPTLPVVIGLSGAALIILGVASLVDLLTAKRTATDAENGTGTGSDTATEGSAYLAGPLARVAGAVAAVAGIVAGAVVLFSRSMSLHTLVLVIAAFLVVHGLASVVKALRGTADARAAALLSGTATAILGVVSLSWPVVTAHVFLGCLGAWLIFVGLRTLLDPVLRRRRADKAEAAGTEAAPETTRTWPRTLLATGGLVLVIVLAGGSLLLLRGDGRPAPGAFYAAPDEVPDAPGQLLRSEPTPDVAPDGVDAWRILYTTTRPDGSATAASGTVFAPVDRGDGVLPLLSVAHGTTGIVPKCAPSLTDDPFADGPGAAVTEMVADHGWVAAQSDYPGLGTAGIHPYLVGQSEARSVLDATRAAGQLDGLRLSEETVLWGHSQGGHAALWAAQTAAQTAAQYAPEITVKGVAALAPATDLAGLAGENMTGVSGKTLSSYIVTAWNDAYPDLHLADRLTPGVARGVEQVAGLCFNQQDVLAAILRGSQIPDQVVPRTLLDGELGDLLVDNTPSGPFPAPVLLIQGSADTLITPSMQGGWVAARRADGQEIDYRTQDGAGHMDLVGDGSAAVPEIVDWTLAQWGDYAA